MSVSVYLNLSLEYNDPTESILTLSLHDHKINLRLETAPEMVSLYEEGYENRELTQNINGDVLTRFEEDTTDSLFSNEICAMCRGSIDESAYILYENIEDACYFHPNCFDDLIEKIREVIKKHSEIFIVTEI